ncbi:hypothetical protein B4U80_08294 [Leptotrombidium deliense]|uniref:EF-hand domain-containing protein n=1 Tax=Leptotrombidium deliense TaxID=299467 RepID=A0A443SF06_9ACAR|nr:hypothetical protein B4U80_08294 [Leptotrombidium deliense]
MFLGNKPATPTSRPRTKSPSPSPSPSSKSTKSSKQQQQQKKKEPEKPVNNVTAMNSQQLKMAFSMLDANNDGKINTDELKTMLRELGIPANDEIVNQMMNDATKNGDGLIDEQQFLCWMSKVVSNQKEDDVEGDLRAAFSVFDKDGNGYITRDELRAALKMMGETLSESDIDFLLKETDSDKDGRINYQEFIRVLL